MEWVKVEDRLPEATGEGTMFPESSDTVFTYDQASGFYSRSYYNHESKYWEDNYDYDVPVTHWIATRTPKN